LPPLDAQLGQPAAVETLRETETAADDSAGIGSTARAVGQGSIPWRGTKPPVPDHGTGDPAVVYAPIDAVQFQAWKAQMPSIAAPPRKGLTSRVRGALTSARAYRTVIW
jgi:hypothetical protein